MPLGYFERIDPTPFKVRLDISQPVRIITQGEIIHADYYTYKDVVGFRFVGWTKPRQTQADISSDVTKPNPVYKNNTVSIVVARGEKQAPYKQFLEEKKATEIKFKEEENTDDTPTDKIEVPQVPVVVENKEQDRKGLIEYLKKLTAKNWFVMRKEDARGYMERLGIDYSNTANNRGEFIKFLKDKLKEL